MNYLKVNMRNRIFEFTHLLSIYHLPISSQEGENNSHNICHYYMILRYLLHHEKTSLPEERGEPRGSCDHCHFSSHGVFIKGQMIYLQERCFHLHERKLLYLNIQHSNIFFQKSGSRHVKNQIRGYLQKGANYISFLVVAEGHGAKLIF